MPRAKQIFAEVEGLIAKHYVDANLSEDELWTGAIEGMLQRLIQLRGQKINALLDPERLREINSSLKGTFSGVGVMFGIVQGIVYVREVLPGTPAAQAEIKPGDRILAIDGKSVRGLNQAEMTNRIRGKEGTTVTLFMQREEREWQAPLIRRTVRVEAVFGEMLLERIGYVRITSFNHSTLERLDSILGTLAKQRAEGLILDLRHCPGGLLEVSLQAAERFLEPGSPLLALRPRSGAEVVKKSAGDHPWRKIPMVVLINKETASGAEIVAAALAGNHRAVLVGEKTFGKGTAEEVFELSNNWALKLSISRFFGPDGKSWQGEGIQPDFVISGGPANASLYTNEPKVNIEEDLQLKAALNVFKLNGGSR
jgi:carboxyl-terminal processing protease